MELGNNEILMLETKKNSISNAWYETTHIWRTATSGKKIKHESSKFITYYYYYYSWGNDNVLFQNDTGNFETAKHF